LQQKNHQAVGPRLEIYLSKYYEGLLKQYIMRKFLSLSVIFLLISTAIMALPVDAESGTNHGAEVLC
jgi:predicted ferric reductase